MSTRAATAVLVGSQLVRAAWGSLLLFAPVRVCAALGAAPPDRPAVVVARLLGARHLVQGLASEASPTPSVTALGAWVDAVHGSTAVGLVAADPPRARVVGVDVGVAAALVAVARLTVGRLRPAGPLEPVAATVLERHPGAGPLRRARPQEGRRRPQ